MSVLFSSPKKEPKKAPEVPNPPGPLNDQGQAPGPQKPWGDKGGNNLQEEHPDRFVTSEGRHDHKS
ncbi:MAG: hypothetical protein FWH52_01850 [Synergistaceae bacterium]|nr:hypothetical protein [Synergistaceae bacterium]